MLIVISAETIMTAPLLPPVAFGLAFMGVFLLLFGGDLDDNS